MPPTQDAMRAPVCGIEPGQLALHLHGQLAGGRDHEGERRRGPVEALGVAEQGGRDREAEGDGLAGAGLRGDQQVASRRLGHQHGGLDGGRFKVVAGKERSVKGRIYGRKGHASTS